MPVYLTDVLAGLVHVRSEPVCKQHPCKPTAFTPWGRNKYKIQNMWPEDCNVRHNDKTQAKFSQSTSQEYICLSPGSGNVCDSDGDTDSDSGGDSGDSGSDSGGDSVGDSDSGGDSGCDSDGDTDSDSGGDTDSDTDSGGGGGSCSPLNWRLCFTFRGLEGNLSEYDEAAHAYSQQ